VLSSQAASVTEETTAIVRAIRTLVIFFISLETSLLFTVITQIKCHQEPKALFFYLAHGGTCKLRGWECFTPSA
jgi:hypothetical protein